MDVVHRPGERTVQDDLARLTLPSGNVGGVVKRLAELAGCDLSIVDVRAVGEVGVDLVAGPEPVGFLRATPLQDFGPEIEELLRIGAPVLALELIKARAAMEHAWTLEGSLLEALIDAGAARPDDLELRAERFGVDLSVPWRLAVIESIDEEPLPSDVVAAAARTSIAGERSLSCLHRRRLVVAVLEDPEAGIIQNKLRHLTRLARGRRTDLRAGVSSPGLDFGRAMQQAEAALDLARRTTDRVDVFHDEMGALRFLLDAPRTIEMAALVTEELGALAERDASRNGQLVETLKAFLEECGNRSRTAEVCQVHISTVKYRLGTIETILGCELGSAQVRFRLMLALEVRKVLRSLGADPLPTA
jgi:sugar diacid utilization regulator